MLALLGVLALPAACAVPGPPGAHLADSSWQFIRIDGAQPVSTKAHLTFAGGKLGANVGCNGMGGPWRVEQGRLLAGPLVQTEMYCAGRVWQQEQAISALLAGAPRFAVNGNSMTLTSSGHVAELVRTSGTLR